MSRQWLLRLVAFMLMAVSFCSLLSISAFAEPTVETLPAPEVEPVGAYAHGDGSVTITNNCVSHEWETYSAVTISPEGKALSGIPRKEGEWKTEACFNYIVPGFDSTVYVVQVQSGTSYRRVVADRENNRLWTQPFTDTSKCGSRVVNIQSITLGQDGNLYVAAVCSKKEAIESIDSSTGAIRFAKELPNLGSSERGTGISEIMPYENGVAILNGNEVFYYNYEGEKESSKTFTATSKEKPIIEIKMVPETGRIYWYTQEYNPEINEYEKFLYYRDPEGSINEEVELPKKQWLVSIFTTPENGVVAEWKECHLCSTKGFDYISEEGSVVYEKILTTETGASVQEAGLTTGTVVDDFGNVIVRRIMDESSGDHDRNVMVDSFSPAGIKTRLFNSSSLGKGGTVDSFNTISPLPPSMGEGHLYLMLCHVTGKITEECNSTQNPEVVSISDTTMGEYDYPRSAIFSAGVERSSYVALGDSYSSGEGVPEFIPPSDEDGCHRSYGAYPVDLAEAIPSLRLDAFVACSGATTTSLEEEMDGEPAQIDALGPGTKVVTITIGGNNIGFREFALDCVASTCDSSSPYYEYSMEQIAVYLPGELETLYKEIHGYAENAEVYVVGYPQVIRGPGEECGVIFAESEEEASREVVSALDGKIREAAEAAEGDFTYVDPNTEKSPFVGHELCAGESYFNGVFFPEKEYSFHPNKLGQKAYAELIAEVL